MITIVDTAIFDSFIEKCSKNCWYVSGKMEDGDPLNQYVYPRFILTVTIITDKLRDKFRDKFMDKYEIRLKTQESTLMNIIPRYYWNSSSTFIPSWVFPPRDTLTT